MFVKLYDTMQKIVSEVYEGEMEYSGHFTETWHEYRSTWSVTLLDLERPAHHATLFNHSL